MTPDTLGRPPRPAHEEIPENEQAIDDHAIDVLPDCQNIMWITYEGIESGLFERGDDATVALTHSILTETLNALDYWRQRKSHAIRIRHTQ